MVVIGYARLVTPTYIRIETALPYANISGCYVVQIIIDVPLTTSRTLSTFISLLGSKLFFFWLLNVQLWCLKSNLHYSTLI
jgi:hypothetical protein